MATKPTKPTKQRKSMIKSVSSSVATTAHAVESAAALIDVQLSLLVVTSKLDAISELCEDYGLTVDQATELLGY